MAKKQKLKKPSRRNMVVVTLIARGGAGAGHHRNKRRSMQVPRKAKHKGLHRPLLQVMAGWRSRYPEPKLDVLVEG